MFNISFNFSESDAFQAVETAFACITLFIIIPMVFWSCYLINEILLARKRLIYSVRYIIDENLGTIKRKCKTDIWKNALLLLVLTSESLALLFGGVDTGTGFDMTPLTIKCHSGFSIDTYAVVQFSAWSMLFTTIAFSSLNLITVFFISIYSYHTEKYSHRKLLIFLLIHTIILIPILLIPHTAVYAMFICICIIAIYSYKWVKNTQRLLLYLKWRYEDMKDDSPLSAVQIKVMRKRYRRLIYILIVAIQPVIAFLLLEFIYQSIRIEQNHCTMYYMLQYLDNLVSAEIVQESLMVLNFAMIPFLLPVVIVLIIPYEVYTVWYMLRIVWRSVTCRRERIRSYSILSQSLLKY